jgi:hypothetical protein
VSAAVVGPFQSSAEVRSAFPIDGFGAPARARVLAAALQSAGVEVGTYDARVIAWLCSQSGETVGAIAGLILRANTRPVSSVLARTSRPVSPADELESESR